MRRTRAQRRSHHAKQRARKQRYRAWEAEHAGFLAGTELSRADRKGLYRLGHPVGPIVRRFAARLEWGMLRNLFTVTPIPPGHVEACAGSEAREQAVAQELAHARACREGDVGCTG
jgi:hypothetical protein